MEILLFILTLQKNAAEKKRHFVPMNFYVQLMPLVFISLYANCWIKKNYRSVEGQTKFLYQCEIIGAIEHAKKEELMKKASRCPIGLSLEQTILFEPFN